MTGGRARLGGFSLAPWRRTPAAAETPQLLYLRSPHLMYGQRLPWQQGNLRKSMYLKADALSVAYHQVSSKYFCVGSAPLIRLPEHLPFSSYWTCSLNSSLSMGHNSGDNCTSSAEIARRTLRPEHKQACAALLQMKAQKMLSTGMQKWHCYTFRPYAFFKAMIVSSVNSRAWSSSAYQCANGCPHPL